MFLVFDFVSKHNCNVSPDELLDNPSVHKEFDALSVLGVYEEFDISNLVH